MSSQNALKLAGALAGGYWVAKEGGNGLGVIAGAVVGGWVGSNIGRSLDNGSLAKEVQRLQLLEEKARIQNRLASMEGSSIDDELLALENDYSRY